MLALGLQVYFSPASTALLQDFNLSSLMSDAHQATYEIRSANEELKLLPAFLKNIPEGEKIFELIQHPSTQATQILQRQTLVEALVDSSQLDSLKDLKNGAYYLNQGVDLLFRRYVEIDEYTRMSVIEAYRSGYQERVGSDIEAGVRSIQEGLKYFERLARQLASCENPFLQKIAEELLPFVESTQGWTRDYILSDDHHDDDICSLESQMTQKIRQIGVFIEFTALVIRDVYAKASFDPGKP